MPAFQKPTLQSAPHSGDLATALEVVFELPDQPPSRFRRDGVPSGYLLLYYSETWRSYTLIAADLDVDEWREVIGAAA